MAGTKIKRMCEMELIAFKKVAIALASIGLVGLFSGATQAQTGSRLCGISLAAAGTAMLVEIEQPDGSSGRKKADSACQDLRDQFLAGVSNPTDWVYHQRSECEGTASVISLGASSADICEGFTDTEGKAAMERNKPYTVKWADGNWVFTPISQ